MLQLVNATLFADNKKKIKLIDDLNLKVKQKEKIVLTGPSGCGKTTFLKNLAGLQQTLSGEVIFNSQKLTYQKELVNYCSYLGQESINYADTVQNLFCLTKNFNNNKHRESFNYENFSVYLTELKLNKSILEKNFQDLSGGEKKRIEFALCLLTGKEVLLLDELLAPLHPDLKEEVNVYLENLDKTVILISHEKEKLAKFREISLVKDFRSKNGK